MQLQPFRDLSDFFNDNRFFKSGFPTLRDDKGELASAMDWTPTADISETENEYIVKSDLPGVDKKDISVSLDDNVLTIQGERKYSYESEDEKAHRVESFYGHFSRSFTLPKDVKADAIKATNKNGVLNVHLPKTTPGKPKNIDIQVH